MITILFFSHNLFPHFALPLLLSLFFTLYLSILPCFVRVSISQHFSSICRKIKVLSVLIQLNQVVLNSKVLLAVFLVGELQLLLYSLNCLEQLSCVSLSSSSSLYDCTLDATEVRSSRLVRCWFVCYSFDYQVFLNWT